MIELDARRRSGRAILWNPGGPDASDSDAAAAIAGGTFAKELTRLRDRYDVVLVDSSGTGTSHELACRLFSPAHPEEYFEQLFPTAILRACRTSLARTADLGQYTTDISADDLEAQQAACRIWDVGPVSPDFTKPVRGDAPTLMISGGSDPATPFTYGRDEVR